MAKVLIETSARHVHLSKEHIDKLFGEGHELTFKKALSQPGQFASEERVTVVGEKKEIKNVSILGPARSATQVEISLTDARSIGCVAPIRESGDIAGSGACKIIGPCGEIEISEGVIAAKRHIHLTPEAAKEMGVSDNRKTVFGDVVIRVSDKFSPAMHIDTDESNAAGVVPGMMVEVLVD